MNYTTLPKIKTWSDILAAKDDSLIRDLVTACSALIDQHCGQVFGRRTAANERCSAVVDASGRLHVYVKAPAVASVTALTFRSPTAGGRVTVDGADLEIEDAHHGAELISASCRYGRYRGGQLSALISGELGWEESDIPPDFELMARKLVFWAYKRRETAAEKTAIPDLGVVIIPQAWPPDIKDGLADYVMRAGA